MVCEIRNLSPSHGRLFVPEFLEKSDQIIRGSESLSVTSAQRGGGNQLTKLSVDMTTGIQNPREYLVPEYWIGTTSLRQLLPDLPLIFGY